MCGASVVPGLIDRRETSPPEVDELSKSRSDELLRSRPTAGRGLS